MKANTGDIIKTTVYVDKNYPDGSLFRVHKQVEELNEVMVFPTWYKAGMKCFGISVFLEDDDYEVVTRATTKREKETQSLTLDTGRRLNGEPIRVGDTLQGSETQKMVVFWSEELSRYAVQQTEIPKFVFDLDEFLEAWGDLEKIHCQ